MASLDKNNFRVEAIHRGENGKVAHGGNSAACMNLSDKTVLRSQGR